MTKKKLTDILGENYLDNYSQKTEVGQSFVALHRAGKLIDQLGDKGKTEGQFKSDKPPAPYKKAPQKGFPGEGQFNDYNLPTYYDDADNEGDPEEDKNDKKRSMKVQEEEDAEDDENDDKEVQYLKIDELDARGILTRYAHKASDGSNKELTPNRQKGIKLALKKKWGDPQYGMEPAKVPGVWDRKGVKKEDVTLTPCKTHLNEAAATRKHFVNVANTVRAIENPAERQKFADHHAMIFSASNPAFNHAKFHAHAGTTYTPPGQFGDRKDGDHRYDPKRDNVVKNGKIVKRPEA